MLLVADTLGCQGTDSRDVKIVLPFIRDVIDALVICFELFKLLPCLLN